MSKKIKVGDVAKDTVTGFEGVVVCSTMWLNGCERITLQPQELRDGKPIDGHTFDVEQCVLVKARQHEAKRETGGPRPEPQRRSDPRR